MIACRAFRKVEGISTYLACKGTGGYQFILVSCSLFHGFISSCIISDLLFQIVILGCLLCLLILSCGGSFPWMLVSFYLWVHLLFLKDSVRSWLYRWPSFSHLFLPGIIGPSLAQDLNCRKRFISLSSLWGRGHSFSLSLSLKWPLLEDSGFMLGFHSNYLLQGVSSLIQFVCSCRNPKLTVRAYFLIWKLPLSASPFVSVLGNWGFPFYFF